jgi:5-methyltetrahydrofolate--homocysteine methyltransferase
MPNPIIEKLERGEIIIGDGAFGTMLQAAGLGAGAMPEAWNVDHPDAVRAVHAQYVAAGADYVTTNTFGATAPRLTDGGLGGRVAEMNHLGVALAREAAAGRAWVAGSVGPTGQLMEPYGPLSIARAEEIYAEQVLALAEAGVDLFVVETHHDADEACAAVRMARQHTDLPIFCTFAFNKRGRTMMGLRPGEAARRVQEAGGTVVGANCGDGPEAVAAALAAFKESATLPLLAKANAGIPQVSGETTVWDVTPEQMAAHARRFVELGAVVIGGCCGTTPAHIAALAAALK